MLDPRALEELELVVSKEYISTKKDVLLTYSVSASMIYQGGLPGAVIRSGSTLEVSVSKLAKDIGVDRVKNAELKGADIIASAWPFCEHNLKDGVEQAKSKLMVVDLVELLAKSIE